MRATLVQLAGGALASGSLAFRWPWLGGLTAGLFLLAVGIADEH